MSNELQPEVEDLTTGSIYTEWFAEDSTKEDRDKTRTVLANSTIQFRLLKKMLKKRFNEKRALSLNFDTPNFDQKKLYLDGYLTALQDVYKLIP